MQFVLDMSGVYLIYLLSIFVVLLLQLSMSLFAPMAVIQIYVTMRSETKLMSEVCPRAATESTLQPVTNERFFHRSANTECGAQLDIRAQGFWGVHHQQTFFDVRVFNPLAATNCSTSSASCSNHMTKKNEGLMNNVFVK